MRTSRSIQLRTDPDRDRSGAALVELALALPLFFLLVLGIVEFGRAMMVGQLATNAAREGARFAIMTGSSNTEVEQVVKDFLSDTAGVDPAKITVTITVTEASGNPSAGNDVANANTRDLCEIKVEVPFDDVGYTAGEFLNGKKLIGQSAMRHE